MNYIEEIREPIAKAHILVPQAYLGNVMTCAWKARRTKSMLFHGNQVALIYELPMAEIVMDF